jgi:hypothetical protein
MFPVADETGEIVSSGAGVLPMLAVLFSIINFVWTWHAKSQSASAEKIQKIEARLDHVEDKQITLEERLKHLPTKDDMGNIALKLEQVLGVVGRQDSEISNMSHNVRRMDDYLREKA